MDQPKLVVQRIADRWTFGREDIAFEAFESKEMAVARAKAFAQRHPHADVVIVDESSRDTVRRCGATIARAEDQLREVPALR